MNNSNKIFLLAKIHIAVITIIYSYQAVSGDYFDPYSIHMSDKNMENLDLSDFKDKGGQLPGRYQTDIYINGEFQENKKVYFTNVNGKLVPALEKSQLRQWGVVNNSTVRWMQLGDKDNVRNGACNGC